MRVYMIRHAIAMTSSGRVATPDGERALTEAGAEKMRRHARALERMAVTFDLVLTSPLLRALQTAQIICEVLKCTDRIERCEALAPGAEIDDVLQVLQAHRSAGSIAMVGHNPDFEEIAPVLIGGSTDAGITFKKGSICCIDVKRLTPQPSGEMIWHLTPKLLRMLAK